jgi:2-oxoglutarate dehydrogenase E2 component (dihydrolipoamide succinyltransferase)
MERKAAPLVTAGEGDQVVEMDRVRKLIADHMVMSKQVSPHVTSVVEADVTDLVFWREKNKEAFPGINTERKLLSCRFL